MRKLAAAGALAMVATALVVLIDVAPVFGASITVNTALDIAPNAQGKFPTDGLCSLRAAIRSAQNNSNADDVDCSTGAPVSGVLDTIQISPALAGSTMTLSYAVGGVVQPFDYIYGSPGSTNPLKIIGPTLLASGFKISGGNAVRPFIAGFLQSANADLTLANLTVQNGNGANGAANAPAVNGQGGALYASEGSHLTFDNVVFANNTSSSQGGAIWAEASTITNNGGSYSGNSSGRGGAIFLNSGPSVLNGYAMLLASNTATDKGGAIASNPGSANPFVHIERSLIRNNTAPANAGGVIYVEPVGAPTATTVEFTDSTIYANSSVLFSTASTQRFNLERNTIKDTGSLFNGFGPSSVRNNIIISTNVGSTTCSFTGPGGGLAYTGTRNLVKAFAQAGDCGINALNPLGDVTNISASLAQNGGPEVQQTFAIFQGSNAIDNANSTYCGTIDARSVARGLDGNGIVNNPQAGDCDIGAYEYAKYVVNWVTGTSSLNEGQGTGNIQAKLRILDPAIASLPSPLNVPVTYDNTSTAAKTIDFNSGANVVFPTGSVDGAVVNYPVTLIQDDVAELFGEEARFDLGNVAGVSIAEPKRHTMSIQDDDQAGVVVDDGGNGTNIAEATPGVGEDVTVKLQSQPDRALLNPAAPGDPASYGPPADVTMSVEPDRDCIVLWNGEQASKGDPFDITIANADWQTGRTMQLRAVNDLYDEDLRDETVKHKCEVRFTFQSQDPIYDATQDAYEANVADNDVAGVNLVPTNDPGVLRENTSDVQTYEITLDTPPDPGKPLPPQPRPPTVITLSPGALCDAGGGAGVAVTRSFTEADYDTPKSVSVGPANDLIVDLLHGCHITTSVSGGDPIYNDLSAPPTFAGTPPTADVSVQDYSPPGVTDDPPFAIVTTSGGDGVDVSEDTPSSFETVSVVLQRSPRNANVTLDFAAADDPAIAGPQIKIAKLTAVPASTASLTFTPANWNVPQLLEVHAVDDDYDEDDTHDWAFSVAMTSTAPGFSDPALRRIVVDGAEQSGTGSVPVHITDNDTSEVLADHTGGTTVVTEAGGTDKVSVQLATHPYQDVTVRVTTDAQCTVEGGSQYDVAIAAGQWNVAHEVTIAAVDDDDLETSPHPCAIHFHALSDDGRYDGLTDDLTADVTDDEVAEVVAQTTGGLAVAEGGAGDTYTVVLNHEPSADVTVDFTNDAQSTTPASVTFTPQDWDQPQTVAVSAVDDDLDEADPHASSIGLGVTSSAIGYGTSPVFRVDGNVASSIGVLVADDDVTGIQTSVASLTLTEAGPDQTYTVALTSEPTDAVEVSLGALGLCSVSPATVTFLPGDWDTGQTVTVTPGSDDVQHQQSCSVKHLVSFTNDATYSALGPVTLTGDVADDDTAGVQLSKASLTLDEAGPDDTYTVVLTSQPDGAVDISLSATGLCTVAPAVPLTFDGTTWATPQTVTVTPGDDNLTGDSTCTVDHAISSTDPIYALLSGPSISGTVFDDDVVGVVLSKTALTLAEGGAADTYTVRLGAGPTADVVVTPTATGLCTVSGPMTFTPQNYKQFQTVTVTPGDDAIDNNRTCTITHAATSADGGYDGVAIADASGPVVDDDTAGVQLSKTSLTLAEGGADDTYTVVLTSEPAADITVTVSEAGLCAASSSTLTFTTTDWMNAQTVTVSPGSDDIHHAQSCAVSHTAAGDDPNYDGIPIATASGPVVDDDTAGIVASKTLLTLAEGGAADTYTVVLTSEPTANVTVALADAGLCSVSPASVTFTAGNWDTARTVTVTPENDDIVHAQSCTVSHTVTSADGDYDGFVLADATGAVADDDTAGVTVAPTSLTLDEGGADGTYTAVLTSEPTADVMVSVTPSGLCTADAASLTFTAADWDTAQTVAVTPGSDDIDHAQGCTVAHAATSADPAYAGAPVASVAVTVTDDDSAGVDLSKASLTLAEGGAADTYTVVLTSEPTADVTVTPSATGLCSVSGAMTFTAADWDQPQTVTVTPGNDAIDDANTCTVSHAVASADATYDGMVVPDASGPVVDDDSAGLVLSSHGISLTEGGGTDTFTVRLATQPTADVVVTPTPSGLCSASGPMTFTAGNWAVPQTVTATGGADAIDHAQTCTVTVTAASGDGAYQGLSDAASGPVADDDTAGVQLSKTSLTLAEGGADDTYTVVLTSQPTADVVVAVSESGLCSSSPDILTFTAGTWSVAQAVTVGPDVDAIHHAQSCTVSHTAASDDANYDGIPIATASGPVVDDDVAGVQLSKTSLTLAEGGADDTYTVVLTSQPAADVTVALAASGLCSVSPSSITLTSDDWFTARTVTVSPENDDIVHAQSCSVSHTVTSGDGDYDAAAVPDATGAVADDDTAGVTVAPTSLTLDEGGADGTYTAVLTSEPTADVMVSVTPSGLCTTDAASLTFTAADWDTAQTVAVTPGSDDIDHAQGCTVAHAATSADPAYAGAPVASVAVTVTDDDSAGVDLSKTSLTLAEGGAADTYTVVLTSEPTADVTVTPSANGLCAASGALTFTAADWDQAQTVTVTPGNDDIVHAQPCTVSHAVASADPAYDGLAVPGASGDVAEDDVASVAIVAGGITLHEATPAATDAYTVVLTSEPTADVVVAIGTADGQTTVDQATLTFTAATWSTPQTVTVSVVDDGVKEASPHAGTITHATSSDDPAYDGADTTVDGAPGSDVVASIGDDETSTTVALSTPADDETAVTATATVAGGDAPRTGTVQFAVDGVDVGSPVDLIGDQAVLDLGILAVGDRTVTATYGGDALHDASSGSTPVTVTVVPRSQDDTATVDEDSGAADIEVLANDKGIVGVAPGSWTQGDHGTVDCGTASCTYAPDADFNGTDTFTYRATDGTASTDAATVTVTVAPVNDAPSVQTVEITVVAGQSVSFDLLATATDVDGDPLTLESYDQPAHGTVSCTPEGHCTYTPDPGFTGADSFSYVLSDGTTGDALEAASARTVRSTRASTRGTVEITVTPAPATTTTTPGTGVGSGGAGNGSGGTLGRTGIEAPRLVGLGLALVLGGVLLVGARRRRRVA